MRAALPLLVCVLCACATPRPTGTPDGSQIQRELDALRAPDPRSSNIEVVDRPYIDPEPFRIQPGSWLRNTRVSVPEPTRPVAISEMMRLLRANYGIDITSQLQLDQYSYAGLGMDDVDAHRALTVILGSAGLDFETNDSARYVVVVPITTRTWYINLPSQKINFSSKGTAGTAAAGAGAAGGQQASGGDAGGQSGVSGIAAGATKNETESTSSVEISSDFWVSLNAELTARLNVLVPVSRPPPDPAATGPAAAAAQASGEAYREVRLGKAILNTSAGSVSVQAPKRLQDEIGNYIDEINEALNTRLEFEGRLYLITSSRQKSEGFDITYFKDYATRHGVIFTNNALGGVTFSAPPVSSTLTAVSGSEISGNLLGLVRADNLLTVFNAFLAKDNDVRTLHKPFIATTTGVPAAYSQFDKQYVNIISENTATSTAGATVSRSNNLIPFEFGINLRIAPRLDPKTKTIRASISLVQILQSGFTEVQQFVTDSAGARPVITRIPLDRRVEIQGDALLNDGDLIVIGGAMSVNEADDSSGFPGLKDIPGLSYVFGNRTSNDAVSTYYFALHVKKKPMS